MATIKSVSTLIVDGDWIESKDQSPEGIRLVQTGNIGVGEYLDKPNRAKYISGETFTRLNCTELDVGDILISRLPDPIGRACVVPSDIGRAITAVDCTIIRLDPVMCDMQYFVQYTQSELYQNRLSQFFAGSTRTRISRKNLEQIEIPLPDIPEQRRIASILGKVDELITLRKEQLAKLDQLVKSRFIELFGNYSETAKLSDVAIVSGGLTKNAKRDKLPLQMPYLRVANVSFASIDVSEMLDIGLTTEEYEKTLLQDGDLLFVEGNGSPDQIGRVAVWKNEIVPCVHQNHLIKSRFNRGVVTPIFAMYYFMSHKGRDQIKSKAVSTSGLYTLSVSKISDLLIPVPPIELQEQFTAFVKQTDKSKLAIQQSLDKLELLKKSLMQEYFG